MFFIILTVKCSVKICSKRTSNPGMLKHKTLSGIIRDCALLTFIISIDEHYNTFAQKGEH